MKQAKWIGRRAVAAALVCIALTATAAAAAIPAIGEAIRGHLGAFAPYAQTVQGAACQDQGIRVQVLSALSDDLWARFYLSVQDVEGDRLNEHLTLEGELENSIEGTSDSLIRVVPNNRAFQLVSYDPESRTALFSIDTKYPEDTRPSRDAQLSLTGMTTRRAAAEEKFSLASLTGAVRKSLPIGEAGRTIVSPSDIIGLGYTDAVLPDSAVVLAPEQDHLPLEGTDDLWVSSMGFASDGCFHIRLGLADGVSLADENGRAWFLCGLELSGVESKKGMTVRETLVPGGVDILYPLFTEKDLALLQGGSAAVYGDYTRPGLDLAGAWDIDFQVEYFSSTVLDWTGELAGRQVRQVTLSPLSVTMSSSDAGGFGSATLYAVKRDGSTVAAQPGTGSYSNAAYGTGASEPVWDAYNTWKFEEPVEPEELVSLSLLGEVIPVRGT